MGTRIDLVPLFHAAAAFFGLRGSKRRTYKILGALGILLAAPAWIHVATGVAELNPDAVAEGATQVVVNEIDDKLPLGVNPVATVGLVVAAVSLSIAWPKLKKRFR